MERRKQSFPPHSAFLMLFGAAGLLFLTCCCDREKTTTPTPRVNPQTVEYYVAHQEEREAKLRECRQQGIDSRGDTEEARDCRAAGRAAEEVFLKPPERRSKGSYKEF
jgi:hypothetical protein